jgi:hypothetical protein
MKLFLLTGLLVIAVGLDGFSQQISADSIRKHIHYLASDELEGRGTGTPGEILAADYIAESFKSSGLTGMGDRHTYFQPFHVQVSYGKQPHPVVGRNVIGFLNNEAEKTIVIGAHFDHLGRGYQSGSLSPESRGSVHNGADDNASGTSGVLELARYLSRNNVKERFNFLFIAFSGEELGLLGSKFFVDNPTIPLESIAFMINMDMIGRLGDEKGLMIGGWGTTSWWGNLVPKAAARVGIEYKVDSSGVGPSDHSSFYLKDKPVLSFFTGTHVDYHKPSDDEKKINVEGEVKILKLVAALVEEANKEKGFPDFKQAGNPHNQSMQSNFKVTLGIMPDYAFSGKGLRMDGVTPGRPASKAGMKAGDIVLRMDNLLIRDIQDYMKALSSFEKGQTIEVEFRRGTEKKVVNVTF